MKKLFIIGNGFDLASGIATSYKEFYQYLKKHNEKIFNITCKFFLGQFNANDMLWYNFEESLSGFDYNCFTSQFEYSNNQLFQELDSTKNKIEILCAEWKNRLDDEFKSWLFEEMNKFESNKATKQTKDVFLNFNYTDSLQKLYGIPNNKIVYIHNNINDDKLLYGHGVKFNFEEMLEHYELVNDGCVNIADPKVLEVWVQYVLGDSLRKKVEAIIDNNKDFESKLVNVKKIIVLGHSLGDVDVPYFNWINQNLPRAKWIIGYYKKSNITLLKNKIKKIGLKNFKLKKTKNLLKKYFKRG